ncbi:DUF86 domain-containing protein [Agrobacterium larrymoorei]|uniref:HepT-like ribonuclease domain-containing protein n=1 Tax=Agrobacterium larrymoorei TaxID=160699 RepID=UPI001574B643|nr:DUF86 domain-containing protein [Agrobacterium larrymoorei]NTJ43047.1 DUF86 domain-containing protein [Agrobacterium larrymoorei]
MNMDRCQEFLADMRRAAEASLSFVSGMQESEFLVDIKTQHAVGMSLIVIGESAVRLMEAYPDFPWYSIRGLRNRVAHGYFTLDLNIIWRTTQTTIPELLQGLDSIGNWRAQGE